MKHKAYFYEKEDKTIWFHLERPSMVECAIPFIFDGEATERHFKDYSNELKEFQKSKEHLIKEVEVKDVNNI